LKQDATNILIVLMKNAKKGTGPKGRGIIPATSHHHLNQRILFSAKLTSPTEGRLTLTTINVTKLN